MDLYEIKRGLRAEIKKIWQMCKDVLAKLEEQESVIAEKDKEIAELEERIADGDRDFELADHQNERLLKIVRHHKYKRCLAMAKICECRTAYTCGRRLRHNLIWCDRWLELAKQFKEAK